MRTYRHFDYRHDDTLPTGHPEELQTPEALVDAFVREYSEPGDRVVDIFAGYGTTLRVAESLERIPVGIEVDPERVDYIRERVENTDHLREGDVRALEPADFPDCQLCFTSPPFMEREDTRNPFENYTGESSYDTYLSGLTRVFRRLDGILLPGATVVVHVSNIKFEGRVTPLAWDVAERLGTVFSFAGEVVITWDRQSGPADSTNAFGYGYDHTYALVFQTLDQSRPARGRL